MSGRLFISHAIEDEATVNRIVDYLESKGVVCWIATRDILPREIYPEAITRGMQGSAACAVIVSAAANASKGVLRELELASHHDKDFIPIRIDDVEPGPGLDYYIRNAQWIDYRRHGERALDRIAAVQPGRTADTMRAREAKREERASSRTTESDRTDPGPARESGSSQREAPEQKRPPQPQMAPASILKRVRGILLTPTQEWPRIAAERSSVQSIVLNHILPLSALQGLAVALGIAIFGAYLGIYPDNPASYAIFTVLLAVVGAIAYTLTSAAAAIAALRFFGTPTSFTEGYKLIAYSATPMMIGGLAAIYPPIAQIGLVGYAYAIVLLYLGVGQRVPPRKHVLVFIAILFCWIVAFLVVGYVIGLASYHLRPAIFP